MGGEGRVAKFVVSAEPGTGDVDGCDTNNTRVFMSSLCWNCACCVSRRDERTGVIYRLFRQSPKDGTVATYFRVLGLAEQNLALSPLLWTLLHDDLFSNTITASVLFYFH